MVASVNKGYELQVTGTNVDTWGNVLNTLDFTVIDNNMGGVVTKSLSNINVALNPTESQMLRVVLNGTLTGNVLVETLAIGMTIVENNCTGNFTVTFRKAGISTAVVIPNGTKNLVTTGASGDPGVVGQDFPSGTRIPFQQAVPPPGWNKDADGRLTGATMQIVTDASGGSYGGSALFTSVFVTRIPTGSVGDTTLSVAQMPNHAHNTGRRTDCGGGTGTAATSFGIGANMATESVGGGQPHGHSLTMNGMDFNIKFANFCVGIRV